MNYRIDEIMLYSSSAGSVKHLRNNETDAIVLTPILNRLFEYLLLHQGQVIDRETFMYDIWEKYGLEGSSNTLTQYLSNLRKIFDIFFPGRECIITVPRKGYRLVSDLLIEREEEQAEENVAERTDAPVIAPTLPPCVRQRQRKGLRLIFAGALLLFIAECLALLLVLPARPLNPDHAVFPLLYKEGDCPVYLATRNISYADKALAAQYSKQIMQANHLACAAQTTFYTGVNAGAGFSIAGSVTLSQCRAGDRAPDACITWRYTRWPS